MSRDIDWKETDRLMAELRKQLEADGGEAPLPNGAEQPSEGTAEQGSAPVGVATADEEAPAAAEEIPAAEPVAEENPAGVSAPVENAPPVAEPPMTPVKLTFFVDDDEQEESTPDPVPEAPAAEEAAPAPAAEPPRAKRVRKPMAHAPRATFETRPDMLDDALPVAPISPTQTKKSRVAPMRTPAALSAEDEVEALMSDLFGMGARPIDEWHSSDPVFRRDAAPAVEEAPVGESVDLPETVTRDDDGQIALALPEIDRHDPVVADGEGDADGTHAAFLNAFTAGRGARTYKDARTAEREAPPANSEEEDFRFFLDMDYEDELGRSVGFEKIRTYHEAEINGDENEPEASPKRRGKHAKQEYVHSRQGITLRKTYAKKKRGFVLHLVLSLAVMLLLFLYENAGLMAALFGGPLDGRAYPVPYVLFGIQLLLLAAVLSYRRLLEGFGRLVRFAPIDSSLCSVIFIVTFVYHIVLLFLPHQSYPVLYLSPAAASLALLSLADLLDWYRESLAFQVVSSTKQKFALLPRVSVGGRQNSARERLLVSEQGETLTYVRPVGFVRNYFANTEKRAQHQRHLGWQLILTLATCVALALVSLATGSDAESALRTFFVTFLVCMPATSLLVTTLPMFLASVYRLKKKSAIIGEEQVYQCDGQTTLVLPDSEVFAPMRNERFELTEGCDEARVLSLSCALLQLVGSPLADSLDTDPATDTITITEIAERGVSAVCGEENVPMLFGNVDYLKEHGIEVQPRGTAADGIMRRLLCVAIDGRVEVLFLARYRLSGAMSALLDEMEGEGVRVMIRSKDPGVHAELLAQLLPERADSVRVLKPSTREVDIRTERVDATIVSIGSATEAARAYATCRRVGRAGKVGKALQAMTIGFGVALSCLLQFLGSSLSPLLATVYMLSWCALHGTISFFSLREKNND